MKKETAFSIRCIEWRQVSPRVFAGRGDLRSDIWQRQVTFERGRTYLIEAASGTGKSSLCGFVYGCRRDYDGTLLFDGTDIRTLTTARWTCLRRGALAMLFQDLRLFPELTAWENVQLKNRLTGCHTDETLRHWFCRLGIDSLADRPACRLSYGQQQRVAFLRALCQPFDFLFLDEPVSHLDAGNAAAMADLLREEAGRRGAGVVVTSIGHRLELDYDTVFAL